MVLGRKYRAAYRRRSTDPARRETGFTLIEVLACLVVLTIVIALALPAIGKARSRGWHVRCLSVLHDIHTLHSTFAEQINKGRFANDFEPDTIVVNWTFGSTLTITDKVLDQTRNWLGPFLRNGWVTRQLEEGSLYCPAAVKRIPLDTSQNPQILPYWSYWYSAAMFTAPELWDEALPERRTNPDLWRRSIGVHMVRYPDRKVLQFESGDYHGSGKRLGEFTSGQGHTNVLCVDGHALAVDPYAGRQALAVPWQNEPGAIYFEGAMPFSAAPDGALGFDW